MELRVHRFLQFHRRHRMGDPVRHIGTPSLRTPLPCGFGTSTSFTGGGKCDAEDVRFHVT